MPTTAPPRTFPAHVAPGEHLRTPATIERAHAIRAGLLYGEDQSLVTTGLTPGLHHETHDLTAWILPFADACAVAEAGIAPKLAVVCSLECADGMVLTVRGPHIASPGIVYPVAESLDAADACGACVFTTGALRGLKEELGLTADDAHTESLHVGARSVIGFARARVDTPFCNIQRAWATASHRDEGHPILVSPDTERTILAGLFPWATT